MEVKLRLNQKEIEEIIAYYFSNSRDAHEPQVVYYGDGVVEVVYEDCNIEEGIL